MSKPFINIHDAKLEDFSGPGNFEAKIGWLGPVIGAEKLGYNIVTLQPGKKTFPYHYHLANEEMFLVLQGSGTLRYDGEEYPIREGDIIAAPPGPSSAHQIINSSDAELKYLAVSTKEPVEIAVYPDSDKRGLRSVNSDGSMMREVYLGKDATDYWEGES